MTPSLQTLEAELFALQERFMATVHWKDALAIRGEYVRKWLEWMALRG